MAFLTRNLPADAYIALLKNRQGNILAIGIAAAATGMLFLCNIITLPAASWQVIGVMLCVTGMLQLSAAWQVRGRMQFVAWGFVVAFHLFFGLFAFTTPSGRFAVLAVVFFLGVIATGILRIGCACLLRPARGRFWLAAGCVPTILIGVFLLSQWPANDLSIAAGLLALDLAAFGLSLVGFSLRLCAR